MQSRFLYFGFLQPGICHSLAATLIFMHHYFLCSVKYSHNTHLWDLKRTICANHTVALKNIIYLHFFLLSMSSSFSGPSALNIDIKYS